MPRGIELKNTPTWHKDILLASRDGGIISSDLYDTLSNYLSFRHFFVHAYSFTLRWEELRPLAASLAETLRQVKKSVVEHVNQ